MNRKKNIFILIIILIFVLCILLISRYMIKNKKNGNNMSSQEVVENILNVNSYKSQITVSIHSNKNSNKYILKQEYNTENGCIQEVLEPKNIAGVKITKKDNNLLIENTVLDLKTFLENYVGLENNYLDLYNFINEYKLNNDSKFDENDQEIIMKIKSNTNKYLQNKELYINKQNLLLIKLLVQDYNQNVKIIIEYNKIELN